MKTTIVFQGKLFPARKTAFGLVAHLSLEPFITNENGIDWLSDEARQMDESIVYYANDEEMEMSEDDLYKTIYDEEE